MCGLVYYQSLNQLAVNELVWDQYQKQKHRGTEGFGLFDGQFTVKAAVEKRIKNWMKRDKNGSDMMLFHHRFPTSTINVKRAAHPFNTGDYFGKTKYVLAHNGVVRNPTELKEAHEKLGIKYQSVLADGTFNDSEALLWDFALLMESKQEEMKAYGGIAFICIKMTDNKLDKMFFGRNPGRPLHLSRTKDLISLSSEGEGEEIKENRLYTYNYGLNRLTDRHFRIPAFDPSFTASDWDNTRTKYLPASGTQQPFGFAGGRKDYQYNRPAVDDRGFYDDNELDISNYEWDDGLQMWVPKTSNDPYDLANFFGSGRATLTDQIKAANVSDREIFVMTMKLLAECEGKYEDAYWTGQGNYYTLEAAYNQALEDGLSGLEPAEIKLMRLNEAACEALTSDPNNIDTTSVHPIWKFADAKQTNEVIGKAIQKEMEVANAK
jgi:hypothetical protein